MHPSRLPKLQHRPPTPNSVIFKAILRPCVIICDIAWHVPEDSRSLDYRCSLALSSLYFCLIKKPNHADASEPITSRCLRMFEDAKATGGEANSDGSWTWSQHCFIFLFFSLSLCSFILINLNHFEVSGVSNPQNSEFSRDHNCSLILKAAVLCRVFVGPGHVERKKVDRRRSWSRIGSFSDWLPFSRGLN